MNAIAKVAAPIAIDAHVVAYTPALPKALYAFKLPEWYSQESTWGIFDPSQEVAGGDRVLVYRKDGAPTYHELITADASNVTLRQGKLWDDPKEVIPLSEIVRVDRFVSSITPDNATDDWQPDAETIANFTKFSNGFAEIPEKARPRSPKFDPAAWVRYHRAAGTRIAYYPNREAQFIIDSQYLIARFRLYPVSAQEAILDFIYTEHERIAHDDKLITKLPFIRSRAHGSVISSYWNEPAPVSNTAAIRRGIEYAQKLFALPEPAFKALTIMQMMEAAGVAATKARKAKKFLDTPSEFLKVIALVVEYAKTNSPNLLDCALRDAKRRLAMFEGTEKQVAKDKEKEAKRAAKAVRKARRVSSRPARTRETEHRASA